MITEDYVSFETAKLLKEKGFNEKTYRCYNLCTEEHELSDMDDIALNNWELDNDGVTAPTLQMAMKWLREEKELLISILPTVDKNGYLFLIYCIWDLADIHKYTIRSGLYSVENYGECAESAIKYCLENLI